MTSERRRKQTPRAFIHLYESDRSGSWLGWGESRGLRDVRRSGARHTSSGRLRQAHTPARRIVRSADLPPSTDERAMRNVSKDDTAHVMQTNYLWKPLPFTDSPLMNVLVDDHRITDIESLDEEIGYLMDRLELLGEKVYPLEACGLPECTLDGRHQQKLQLLFIRIL
ncbi:hypothetical protein EVAR_7026_1 [Eumeta japonica]|uniref:Uncharacterized protein n=1 Tax=Eumeta variegata TaxID=151549 RepID=A0A4C1THU7_EUMVA|nr:hypothetical protein EVAR_7026_1 [Eumeta japonica]